VTKSPIVYLRVQSAGFCRKRYGRELGGTRNDIRTRAHRAPGGTRGARCADIAAFDQSRLTTHDSILTPLCALVEDHGKLSENSPGWLMAHAHFWTCPWRSLAYKSSGLPTMLGNWVIEEKSRRSLFPPVDVVHRSLVLYCAPLD
jgi:hypothetical protein